MRAFDALFEVLRSRGHHVEWWHYVAPRQQGQPRWFRLLAIIDGRRYVAAMALEDGQDLQDAEAQLRELAQNVAKDLNAKLVRPTRPNKIKPPPTPR